MTTYRLPLSAGLIVALALASGAALAQKKGGDMIMAQPAGTNTLEVNSSSGYYLYLPDTALSVASISNIQALTAARTRTDVIANARIALNPPQPLAGAHRTRVPLPLGLRAPGKLSAPALPIND